MPSLNTPAPEDLRTRVLSATLAEVRSRRSDRRRSSVSAAAILLIAAASTWLLTRPDVSPLKNPNIATQNPPAAPAPIFPVVTVERITESPLKNIRHISTSTPSSIARIPEDPTVKARFKSLTDDQLLAAIPAGQPVALVHISDGTSRLVLFP